MATYQTFPGLPEFSYGVLATSDEVILIRRGEMGYYKYRHGALKGDEAARQLNERAEITPAQAEAMEAGSLFGWDVPGANPETYDETGRWINK